MCSFTKVTKILDLENFGAIWYVKYCTFHPHASVNVIK